jgi:hypothetical protein
MRRRLPLNCSVVYPVRGWAMLLNSSNPDLGAIRSAQLDCQYIHLTSILRINEMHVCIRINQLTLNILKCRGKLIGKFDLPTFDVPRRPNQPQISVTLQSRPYTRSTICTHAPLHTITSPIWWCSNMLFDAFMIMQRLIRAMPSDGD